MSWQATARRAAQRLGLDPRYVRRLRWVHKARAVRRCGAPLRHNLRFVALDPEPDNFTYELANESELAAWTADVGRSTRAKVESYFAEPQADRDVVRAATAGHRLWSKRSPPFGKRLAWYALARIVKPELVVETGVHDGLGSLLLLRALARNREEGSAGHLVSFDVNPSAGWLVGSHPLWRLRIESSRTGLPALLADDRPIGLFIHDSLHTYENEHWELSTAASHLAPAGVLVTDNAHVTRALADVCSASGLEYFEFRERPRGHFYPGGALGAGRSASGP